MDTFFGFHIGKGIARNVNIENGPPIEARFLDPKTGPPFGEIVKAFAAAFLRLTRAGFVWMWNSLQVYISDMAHGSLPINHAPRNRQQHCFKILWSFDFCPSGAVHLFFSCVCLMASMARSVNCLGRKKAVQVHLIGAKPIVQVRGWNER